MIITENYLKDLYTTYEQEIRGDNKPIEDVDNRPNYIGMCINMMESDQMKISCLRKVREMTVMNPFYQYRIDRFIDAITNTYEPTTKPGFNEFIMGDKDSALAEGTNSYLNFLNDQGGAPGGGPPAKFIKLKSSGAEQDDEEPPTDERTKKFEKDEAKVGSVRDDINEIDWSDPYTAAGQVAWAGIKGGAKLAAAHPKTSAAIAGLGAAALLRKKLKQDKKQGCYHRYEGYPDKIKQCLQGQA